MAQISGFWWQHLNIGIDILLFLIKSTHLEPWFSRTQSIIIRSRPGIVETLFIYECSDGVDDKRPSKLILHDVFLSCV